MYMDSNKYTVHVCAYTNCEDCELWLVLVLRPVISLSLSQCVVLVGVASGSVSSCQSSSESVTHLSISPTNLTVVLKDQLGSLHYIIGDWGGGEFF